MTRRAYLTIDDSPSDASDSILALLSEHDIPALFFCRGDRMEADPTPIRRAIEAGYIIGNHLYSHRRAGTLDYETICDEILRTEALIDRLYKEAGKPRHLKTLRFPYLDRGMGAWFVEPEAISDAVHKNIYQDLIAQGLGNHPDDLPDTAQIAFKDRLQEFLTTEGFAPPAFESCTADWYRSHPDVQAARDTLLTCSSSDWMLTARHHGRWQWSSVPPLVQRMINRMEHDDGAQIILLHDQAELQNSFKALIDGLCQNSVEFLPIT